jgi:hypothetical protein
LNISWGTDVPADVWVWSAGDKEDQHELLRVVTAVSGAKSKMRP